jgi:hypothetical protein
MIIKNANFSVELSQTNSDWGYEQLYLSAEYADELRYILKINNAYFQLNLFSRKDCELKIFLTDKYIILFSWEGLLVITENKFKLDYFETPIVDVLSLNNIVYVLTETDIFRLEQNEEIILLKSFPDSVKDYSLTADSIKIMLDDNSEFTIV